MNAEFNVECVERETGRSEFRTYKANNAYEASKCAELDGYIVGRVKSLYSPKELRVLRIAGFWGRIIVALVISVLAWFIIGGLTRYVVGVYDQKRAEEEIENDIDLFNRTGVYGNTEPVNVKR